MVAGLLNPPSARAAGPASLLEPALELVDSVNAGEVRWLQAPTNRGIAKRLMAGEVPLYTIGAYSAAQHSGIVEKRTRGSVALGHGGVVPDASAQVEWFPDTDIALVVLADGPDAAGRVARYVQELASALVPY
jgi:hypothetical protein